MSLIDAITNLKTGTTYTVTRRAANSVVDGRVVAGADSTFSIVASVSPMSGKDLMSLPEAYHTKSVHRVITETALRSQTSASGAADRVTIDGVLHTVFKLHFWEGFGEKFYEAFVVAEPS